MTERVLLAGCGDLGLRVARQLLERGDFVWALRRTPRADEANGIHWLCADLHQPESLRDMPPGITQLVYLPTPDRRDESAYRATFADGLRYLWQALDRDALRRVLFVSSTAVYGAQGEGWVDENTEPSPKGFNGEVLLEAERWLVAQPVRSVVLRLAGLYGPGRLQLVDRLRSGVATVPRDPPHWANRIHVDDAAAAIVHLLGLPGAQAVYIGADDTPLPLDVLCDDLAKRIGAPLPAEGPAPAGVGSKRLCNARLRQSGLRLRWPDARDGYAALLDS